MYAVLFVFMGGCTTLKDEVGCLGKLKEAGSRYREREGVRESDVMSVCRGSSHGARGKSSSRNSISVNRIHSATFCSLKTGVS